MTPYPPRERDISYIIYNLAAHHSGINHQKEDKEVEVVRKDVNTINYQQDMLEKVAISTIKIVIKDSTRYSFNSLLKTENRIHELVEKILFNLSTQLVV